MTDIYQNERSDVAEDGDIIERIHKLEVAQGDPGGRRCRC